MDLGTIVLVVAIVIVIFAVRRRTTRVGSIAPTVVEGHEGSPFAGIAPEAQRAIAEKWIGCMVTLRVRHAEGFTVIDGRRVVVERVSLIYGHGGFGVLVTPTAETGEIMIPLEMIMGVN
jgi:hypothetical protein